MTNKAQHTATPWKVAEVYFNNSPNQWHITTGKWGDKSICEVDTQANAAFIVKACNNHDALVEQLRLAFMALKSGKCIEQTINGIQTALAQVEKG